MNEEEIKGWRAGIDAPEVLTTREWLVTNGLGGYASGTLGNINTRRHHSVLVAALPAPHGRMLMLRHLAEQLRFGEHTVSLTGKEHPTTLVQTPMYRQLAGFRLECGLPVWRFEVDGVVLEKRVVMPHRQNTTCVLYRLLSDHEVRLELRPSMHFRPHEGRSEEAARHYTLTIDRDRYEIGAGDELPLLRLHVEGHGRCFVADHQVPRETFLQVEAERGYDPRGVLWNPGYFSVTLMPGRMVTFTASTEPWHAMLAFSAREAAKFETARRRRLMRRTRATWNASCAGHLAIAADQFVITPAGRIKDSIRAFAEGNEVRTVIAGYHWFTDWGRDTMISLEGLTLHTGREAEAGYILRTFADYMREGLIPNMFPEQGEEGLYHTADATLWFFHAIDRYLALTGDRGLLQDLLPCLQEAFDFHVRGTRFGIRADPRDGLLMQGQAGYQLTWMDAKVGDWVVTPRRGKAVEINGLWYNALRLLGEWLETESGPEAAQPAKELAERVHASFNERFWYDAGCYLYDVIDGEEGADPACRPNQLLAFSLHHPVLDRARWQPVLKVVQERLLTPVGLRSLAPGHPDYKEHYFGDLHARDAAYHQGTVWAWLIGPFVDGWLRVNPEDKEGARQFLGGLCEHLREAGIGSVSEIYDAEPPYTPRGCIAQAWSVAELLRCLVKTT